MRLNNKIGGYYTDNKLFMSMNSCFFLEYVWNVNNSAGFETNTYQNQLLYYKQNNCNSNFGNYIF